jgi:hypothetical protein
MTGFCDGDCQSAFGHQDRSALLLEQDHQEFCRFGAAGVPAHDMNIVGAFIKSFPWRQRHFFSALHLRHDGALQHVDEPVGVVPADRVRSPGAYSTVRTETSLPGISATALDMSGVTLTSLDAGVWAASAPAVRNNRSNINFLGLIVFTFRSSRSPFGDTGGGIGFVQQL